MVRWTLAEEKLLRDQYPKFGFKTVIPGRSKVAISVRAVKLGLQGPITEWSEEEVLRLKIEYPFLGSFITINRSLGSIKRKANSLKIFKIKNGDPKYGKYSTIKDKYSNTGLVRAGEKAANTRRRNMELISLAYDGDIDRYKKLVALTNITAAANVKTPKKAKKGIKALAAKTRKEKVSASIESLLGTDVANVIADTVTRIRVPITTISYIDIEGKEVVLTGKFAELKVNDLKIERFTNV